ncbi:MmcQ/YjbR family DNA-binding protein [Sphaerisporangium sp. TRM90804]|uniref:MmcQ/YjbR family DNA-binding protein n=1 Tax=Sphaerisporangium sp. TRM90804 TaxID=3031113 RepID=UPI00244CB922|nr:MmcQ/YjbR family DNA-binding protein [Sphaerisporangium sp. TRM90804]MDH2429241.1 MmcQ/YjbR family DNA-binding protein [Sphaerisporangium sp. TRM90804]
MSEWRSRRDQVREFALGLPEAYEEFPWGESVIKVNKKVFVFLGMEDDAKWTPRFSVKLRESHGHALSLPGAEPTSHGLGRAGWVSVPFKGEAPDAEVLCDWVEESYRIVAPRRLAALIDAPPS